MRSFIICACHLILFGVFKPITAGVSAIFSMRGEVRNAYTILAENTNEDGNRET
jgi:hypothetical protein